MESCENTTAFYEVPTLAVWVKTSWVSLPYVPAINAEGYTMAGRTWLAQFTNLPHGLLVLNMMLSERQYRYNCFRKSFLSPRQEKQRISSNRCRSDMIIPRPYNLTHVWEVFIVDLPHNLNWWRRWFVGDKKAHHHSHAAYCYPSFAGKLLPYLWEASKIQIPPAWKSCISLKLDG